MRKGRIMEEKAAVTGYDVSGRKEKSMGKFNKDANTNLLYIGCDIVFATMAFLLASFVSGIGFDFLKKGYFIIIMSFLAIYILSGKNERIYNTTTFFYADRFFKRVTKSFLIATAVVSTLLLWGKQEEIDRGFYLIFLIFCYAALLFSAFFVHFVLKKKIMIKRRTILIGYIERYEKFVRFLEKSNTEVDIVGYVSLDEEESGEYLGNIKKLENIIHEYAVDQIYIMERQYGDIIDVQPYINMCVEMGVTARIIMNAYSGGAAQSYVSSVGTYPVITYHTVSLNVWARAFKRIIDIVGSLMGIIVLSPFMLVTALAIKIDSKGPVIFKQKRVGMNGRNFNMYKFRSMCIDAEEKKQELMKQNEMDSNFMFKMKDDPRITRVGKFIRKTSIDELPQFFNVLFGDMSLVGTRPPTIDEVEQYERRHWRRISIKPGITGMWQVSGRSTITDFDEIVQLDTQYIDCWDVFIDFKIMLQTILQVFTGKGAF